MERHRCKICSKYFPGGRSLRGHMRSHMRFNSSATEKEKLEKSYYGLKENPKKTSKLSDFDGDDPTSSSSSFKIKQCKMCGKEFPSWKAPFGHMRCHSDKICRRSFETEEQQEEAEDFGRKITKQRSIAESHSLQVDFYSTQRELFWKSY